MFIPLSFLPKLKVGLKKKLSLCALFAVGVFCMVAAVMRMVMSLIDIASISPVLLWTTVEEAVVLMVANAPMLRVFFWRGQSFASVTETSQLVTTTFGTGRDRTTIYDDYELSSTRSGVVGMVTSPKAHGDRFVADDPKAVLCIEVNVETIDVKTIDEDASTTKSAELWTA
jgi:hypothetical protein